MSHIILTPCNPVRLGQYDMVRMTVKRTIGKQDYYVAIYGAYNAGGLIGPENNGIVVIHETKKTVVLDEHMKEDSGYFGASARQQAEFQRINTLDDAAFIDFLNAHPRCRFKQTLSGKRPAPPRLKFKLPKFTADQFIATQFESAAEKAKFANHFTKFVARGFRREDFPKWFYTRLSMTFGHIAHYDINGFYDTFFTSPTGRVEFMQHTLQGGGYGNPAHTYCDVEKVLKEWVRHSRIAEVVERDARAALEASERETLAKLSAKYAGR